MQYIHGKGYFEASGKLVGSKRKVNLQLAKVYGYENDLDSYTRLIIESRVSRQLLDAQFRLGAQMRQAA